MIKVEYEIDLWIVGKGDQHLRVDAPGSRLTGQVFSIGNVTGWNHEKR